MKILITLIISIGLLSVCASSPTGRDVYDDIGGRTTIEKFYGLAIVRIYNDPVLGPQFKDVPRGHLLKTLTNQLCALLDGPCTYEGKNMIEAHQARDVSDAEFYRLVEHVRAAMGLVGLTYEQQNVILQKLAPLKADIVYQGVPQTR